MSAMRPPKFLVFEDFLSAELRTGLLEFALANEGAFEPAEVVRDGAGQVDPEIRLPGLCELGLGPHKAAFNQAVSARLEDYQTWDSARGSRLGVGKFSTIKARAALITGFRMVKHHGDCRSAVGSTNFCPTTATAKVLAHTKFLQRKTREFG